ncbi:MAG: hypothetical protein IJQ21_06660 [Lachnospiraceae bacterium]|nr:hypothetical protein [Lachnospiraceae bacterium]
MFGYITVNRPELKIREFERYHAYYCGVCRDLRAGYGLSGQMTLSYDLTFLGILLTSLYEPREKQRATRCLIHPLTKHPMMRNEYTAYAAAMNVLLAYHKALDDRADGPAVRGAAVSAILSNNYRKIVNQYPRQAAVTKRGLKVIRRLEAENNMNEDACAGAFGKIMACLFTPQDDVWKPYLYRLGFYLGKFIYLLDAWDDVDSDIRTGNFNPFKNERNNDKIVFDAYCENLLTMMISEAAKAFEALPLLRDAELLRNILYAGVWTRFRTKTKHGTPTNRRTTEGVCPSVHTDCADNAVSGKIEHHE